MNIIDNSHHYWRFWPVLCLAFLYPMNMGLINLAIPLYFFRVGVAIELIGFLAAGSTMTYCFSPILLNKVSNRINRRRSVILGIVGITFAQMIFYFTLEPIPFLIARVIEGFMAGFIWANLQSSISDNFEHDHSKYMARYNFTWNLGIFSGYLSGTLILFFIEDLRIVFYSAPLLIVANAIIIIFFFQESTKNNNLIQNSKNDKNQEKSPDIIKGNIVHFTKYSIPVIIPVLCIVAYCLARVSANFLYPLKSEILGFSLYTVYLLSCLGFATQIISITLTSYLSINYLKKIPIISIIALIVILILLGINTNFFIFIALFLFAGFFIGTLYSTSLKLFLTLNIKNNTSKYSSILESIIGLTFLLGPITTAFIAKIDINLSFYFLSLVFFFLLLVLLVYMRKIEITS